MSGPATLPAELVTDPGQLTAAVRELLREPAVAVDTESNSYHRYPERLCLVQVGTRHRCYLIDPLAIQDVRPLGRLLADERVQKVIHSADYDLRSLDREWGFRVRNLYDTSVAAHFAGLDRLGLAAAAQHFLGVTLNKSKSLQRADWSLRPLSKTALAYAAADVQHLLALRDAIEAALARSGRGAWVREECARLEEVRHTPPEPPERACLGMKGTRSLDGRGLAILTRLAALREREARRRGRPPFRVLSEETLVYLASHPHEEIAEAPGLGPSTLGRLGSQIRQALREGLAAEPVERPAPPEPVRPRMTGPEPARFERLRAWRNEEAKAIGLDPALVWPMASLERLARAPATLDEELRAPEVRRWQAERFAPGLRALLRKMAGAGRAAERRA